MTKLSASRLRAVGVVFWLALIFAVVMALLPKPPHVLGNMGDKYQHMLAFGTLALLGCLAFPKFPLDHLAERLSFLGAWIEVAQSIPVIHRDIDILDWVADTDAIVVVLGLIAIWRVVSGGAACPPLTSP